MRDFVLSASADGVFASLVAPFEFDALAYLDGARWVPGLDLAVDAALDRG